MSFINEILNYFFQSQPYGPFKYMYLLLAIAGIAIVLGIALRIYLKKMKEDKTFKKLFRDAPKKLFTFAALEVLYILVHYERFPIISMRALNYILLGWALYFSIRYIQLYVTVYPEEKRQHVDKLKMNKYLPRKRKGKSR